MAISPRTRYPGQIDITDPAGYPEGAAQNVTVSGDGTGTPLEKDLTNDVLGFQQALLAAAGLTPSGTPEKVGASQYLDAVRAIAGNVGPTLIGPRGFRPDYHTSNVDKWELADDVSGVPIWQTTGVTGKGALIAPIRGLIPAGATITRLRALIEKGSGEASSPDRASLTLARQHSYNTAPANFQAGLGTYLPAAATVTATPATGLEVLDTGVISVSFAAAEAHYLRVQSQNNTDVDKLGWAEVTWSAP